MKRAFVTGHPVGHSRSPLIHGHWLKSHGIDGSYEAVDAAPEAFEDFIAELKSGASGFIGGNVTIPHKEAAFRLADLTEDSAKRLGAANTLWVEDGQLHAANTDGYGFLANLDQQAPGWSARAGKAVVLGAGGASRAILAGLVDRGFASIILVNRTVERAQQLAEHFGTPVEACGMDGCDQVLEGADLFVNTSALGMGGGDVPALEFERMAEGATVTDIVYVPLETPFLTQARGAGLKTADGLGMLLHQAVPGFEKWFGVRPEVTEELRARIVADIEAKR
jgi:shikimate dehydrogenase